MMTYLLKIAFLLSFWDKNPSLPQRPTFRIFGSILGLILALVVVLGLTAFRFFYENLSSLFISLLLGFSSAQKRLRVKPLFIAAVDSRSRYQQLLGLIAQIAYLPGYLLGLSYGLCIQLIIYYSLKNCMDGIGFFLNLSIYDLRRMTDEDSLALIGKQNFFGIVGYIPGVVIGLFLAVLTMMIRFIVEFVPGLRLGFFGQGLIQPDSSALQDVLRGPAYMMGLMIAVNLKVFWYLQIQPICFLVKDLGFDLKQSKSPKLIDLGLGCLGCFVGLPVSVVLFVFALLLRLAHDSSKSFFQSFIGGQKSESLSLSFVLGLPGKLCAYGLIAIMYLPSILALSLYKWQNLLRKPRFDNHEQRLGQTQLETLKSLYGMLNNVKRQLPETLPQVLPSNLGGGKGSYCFISKVLHLNRPTVSEVYLDKTLAEWRKSKMLKLEDLQNIQADLRGQSGFNPSDHAELEHVHRCVSFYLAS